MDYEARKEWENYCALAEIEDHPDKFLEISDIVRMLDEDQARVNRHRPAARLRYPSAPSNVA